MRIKGNRTHSSRRWLERQRTDPYVKRSVHEGYRSRAAYKLIEIDDRFDVLSKARLILDLGAAPGGWSQVLAQRCVKSRIVALDLLDMPTIPRVEFLLGDFLSEETQSKLTEMLKTSDVSKPDCILSDMAPSTIGHFMSDHLRMMALAEDVLAFTCEHLALGGSFLIKLFQGGEEKEYADQCRRCFTEVRFVKPSASRKESREIYLLCRGFHLANENADASNESIS